MPEVAASRSRRWLFFGVGVLFVWVAVGWALPTFASSDRGSFGDSFGGVAALFSGAAFVAVIVTLYLQTQELGLQRVSLTTQSFEAGFFRLMDLHARERARYAGPHSGLKPGDEALKAVAEEIVLRAKAAFESTSGLELKHNWQRARGEVNGPMWSWLREVGIDAYASRLALLVLMLERSPDPDFHGDVLRASLTAYEMMILVTKALDENTNRLARLVKRFDLAGKLSGKVGPTPQVLWLVAVMHEYAESDG